jgi:hypothetical protein
MKFDTSRFKALFPSLTGTNLFGEIFLRAFVDGLRDLVRKFEDTVEETGFGVSSKLLRSTFVSSKEIWLKLTANAGVRGDCVDAGLIGS